MIEINELYKTRGGKALLDGVSYHAKKGGVHGIVGASRDSVKALLDIICGCTPYTEGRVFVLGSEVMRSAKEIKKKVGYMQCPPVFYEDMTAYEHLVFVGEAKNVPYDKLYKNIKSAIELTGIDGITERLISKLTPPQKQRLAFASAMLGNPDIIVLDEPTDRIKKRDAEDIVALIKKLGTLKTVIVASSDMSVIEEVCDDVLILSVGSVLMHGEISDVRARLSKSNALRLSVKGREEAVVAKLSEISGITDCTVIKNDAGVLSLKLEYKSESDIREQVFAAFASASMPILSMEEDSVGLSDLYLKLSEIENIKGGKDK